jgi:hypothetical protein
MCMALDLAQCSLVCSNEMICYLGLTHSHALDVDRRVLEHYPVRSEHDRHSVKEKTD